MEVIKGKILGIAKKHDWSRIVQTALQYSNEEVQRSCVCMFLTYVFCEVSF